ncbi:monofunctional biosynthetic peptidoglycan transglycosylase [Mesonia ostreae]|uniref:Biosynthetic peptidoglycan transglycosylase n=1 Tax=Mesonia ostreae TaxID=861110 RepID=A0ABU2KJ35_9FLAO|nr:monofunctional biosynthetic peptidoglycan transglycosylase [Mesonia ostreae]MDT0294730.1 monofunctional biosynthetic peptidoglycan transglycosylase [Mesonia ostreae]
MKRFFKFIGKLILWFFGITILWVVIYKWVPVPITPLMVIRYVETPSENRNGWQYDWEPIENISVNLQKAVICSEDQNFLKHNGFDLEAIEKAIQNNKKGKRLRGASSISQQTAKNVFLWPGRNWLRKGLEVYFTFLIETIWSKERLLEVYVNSIEMGNGVYGAEAAANFWFKKSASQLSASQAAAIAAILPNPLQYRANPPTSYIQSRKAWITRQMDYYGPLTFDPKENKK